MRVTVFGAGALGGYFGARLQQAGHDVTYIARGAHLAAMQSNGLSVESPLGNIRLDTVRAVATPDEAGPADLVLFMVKNYDVETAATALASTIQPDTVVVTAQNGVSAQVRLGEIIGFQHVMPGAIYMPADIKAPGVIRHSSRFHRIAFGELNGDRSDRARAIQKALAETGIDATLSDDIWRVLWEKFVLMAPNSAITALTRLDIGPIRDTPATLALLRRLIEEAAAVAGAENASVQADVVETTLDFLVNKAPATMHASMLDDLQRGRRLELDWLSGEIVRKGQKHGIDTPSHAFALAVLAPFANGATSP